eukprot:403356854
MQFIREGELLKQLKEYNAKNVILQLSHIANLTGPQSDKRFDLCYLNNEEFEDEPQPAPYDNYVANLCQKIVRQHNQNQNEDESHDISLLRVDSRSATKRTSFGIKKFSSKLGVFTSNEFRRGSLNYSEKSSPEQYSSRKKINTKEGFFEMSIVRQIKLDEQKPKSYEIMDEQTQILIDRLRGQQKKKEKLKELQKQRQKQKRKEQNQPNKKESIIGINTTDFNRLMNGDISLSHFKDLDYKDTLSKRQNGDHSEISKQSKIKVERLPKTFPEGVKTSFSSVTQSQETQISQMIKEIQKRKLEERGLLYSQGDQQSQNIQEYQNQDLDHLMQSNNLISNQIIQLQDYQIPTRKIIQMNYGVAYKDRQTQLVGESYTKKPNQKTQMTMEQFVKMSNEIEKKYHRSDQLLMKKLTRAFNLENLSQKLKQNLLSMNSSNLSNRNDESSNRLNSSNQRDHRRLRSYSRSKIFIHSPQEFDKLTQNDRKEEEEKLKQITTRNVLSKSNIKNMRHDKLQNSGNFLPALKQLEFDEKEGGKGEKSIQFSQSVLQSSKDLRNLNHSKIKSQVRFAQSTTNSGKISPLNQSVADFSRFKIVNSSLLNSTFMDINSSSNRLTKDRKNEQSQMNKSGYNILLNGSFNKIQ